MVAVEAVELWSEGCDLLIGYRCIYESSFRQVIIAYMCSIVQRQGDKTVQKRVCGTGLRGESVCGRGGANECKVGVCMAERVR